MVIQLHRFLILQKDKRYTNLDSISDERTAMLDEYIDDQDRKGPSKESSRRW